MGADALESYFGGRWLRGEGVEMELVDPTNGASVATASARGLNYAEALGSAREHGGPALRALSYG